MKRLNRFSITLLLFCTGAVLAFTGCKPKQVSDVIEGDAAERVYVPPGKYDEFYMFASGGFSGQVSVYGLPSGRLLKVIPVFSQNPENGYGYSEETKPMLNTTGGFVPWDDAHHPEMSQTNGEMDGRWMFINGNNTPRIARINLTDFKTDEILEIPNCAGNHASAFTTPNTEYVVSATRFSVPIQSNPDVPISSYKENFRGTISFIKVDKNTGQMNIAFQLLAPGVDYDLSHAGKGPSDGWMFFTCYNSEKAHTLLEVNASQNDKDFVLALNWKKLEEYLKAGKAKDVKADYAHNLFNEETHTATSTIEHTVKMMDMKDLPGAAYFIPCPKSPHGVDIDPTGQYIVAGGKLAAVIPVYSFKKIQEAIANKQFEGTYDSIPVLKYEATLAGEVKNPGLGPLHTEFDDKGNAYTTMFISSEIVKWKVATQQVLDRIKVFYSPGHLMVPGGDTRKPFGKYLVALNKITKDRYLPTGPELAQSAQLIDISGDKMKMLLDFPTIGEPHYAQGVPADLIRKNQIRIYKLTENKNAYKTLPLDVRVERNGNTVHVYMTAIRSHLTPDNIEGIKMGDEVIFHVTNVEQDWDAPHGFAIKGNNNAELLIMPGETASLSWKPQKPGIYPFYCTDFCSALHQEMQGYIRVSPAGSNVPLSWGLGNDIHFANKKD